MANPIGIPTGLIRQIGDLKHTMVDVLRRLGNLEHEFSEVKDDLDDVEDVGPVPSEEDVANAENGSDEKREPRERKVFTFEEKLAIMVEIRAQNSAEERQAVYDKYGINKAYYAQWKRLRRRHKLR